jgi:hypothetical protein
MSALTAMSRAEPGSAGAVKAVSVISTGTVRIHPGQLHGTASPCIGERGQIPGVGNRRRLAESSRKVLALAERQPGLVVLPAHDPTAAQRLLDS